MGLKQLVAAVAAAITFAVAPVSAQQVLKVGSTPTGIPFTFSIADGLALGFLAYPVMKLLAGRGREVPWLVYLLAVLFAARYLLAS